MLHRIRRSTHAPSNTPHHHLMDKIAEANAVVSGLAFYPQLFQAIQTRSTTGLSITTMSIVCGANIIWCIYGLHRKDVAITISAALALLAAIPLSIMHVL